MWPWGHVAVAYLVYAGYVRVRGTEPPGEIAVLIVAFGALFPDLVDKPLSWYLGILPTGRTLAHSLVVLIPLCALVYLIARHRGKPTWGVAFGIGAISHALVDALPTLWRTGETATFLLFPLIPVESYADGAPTVLGLLANAVTQPYFYVEFVLLGVALLLWRRHAYPGIGLLRATVARAS